MLSVLRSASPLAHHAASKGLGWRASGTLKMAAIREQGRVLGGDEARPEVLKTFEIWHACVEEMKTTSTVSPDTFESFRDCVHERVVFSPPTYYKPWEGRDEFMVLIECVGEVFGTSFTYGRQWLSPCGREWALEVSP